MNSIFKNMTVSQKLWFNGIIAAIIFAAIASFTQYQQKTTEKGLHSLVDVQFSLTIALNGLYSLGLQTGQATRNVILDPGDEKALDNFKKACEEFDKTLTEASGLASGNEKSELDHVKTLMIDVQAINVQAMDLARAGNTAEAVALIKTKGTPNWREAKDSILKLIQAKKEEVHKIKEEVKDNIKTNNRIIHGLLIAVILFYAMISIFIGKNIITKS